jgi:hypothetical protein
VEHKASDATLGDPTEVERTHGKIAKVVGKKTARGGLDDSENAGGDEAEGNKEKRTKTG